VFVIKEKPHPLFKREGNDLIYEASVPLKDALIGASVKVPTIDGRKLKVTVPDGIIVTPGYQLVVENEGMPLSKRPDTRGNLVVRFKVEFPKKLSDSQKKALSEIL